MAFDKFEFIYHIIVPLSCIQFYLDRLDSDDENASSAERKITRIRQQLTHVLLSINVIREQGENMDNEDFVQHQRNINRFYNKIAKKWKKLDARINTLPIAIGYEENLLIYKNHFVTQFLLNL